MQSRRLLLNLSRQRGQTTASGTLVPPGPTASFEIRVIDNLMDVGTQSSDIAVHGVVIGGDNVFDFTNNTIRSAGSGISLFDGCWR